MFQTIQFNQSIVFGYTQLNVKTVLFKQFSLAYKTFPFQTIQFTLSSQSKYQINSISTNSV